MTSTHFVKKARKSYPESGINKGESYYWWKFRFGVKHKSKTAPSRSQLVQSSFLSAIYDLEDGFNLDKESPQCSIDDFVSELETLKEECEENLSNMPEQLQESSMLQERIENLEEWVSELESVGTDIEEDLAENDKKERLSEIDGEVQDTFGKF